MPYRALGEVTALVGDDPVHLGGARQRELLAVLLARAGQVVRVDVIVEALWPALTPITARGRVQTVVSRLRRALGDAATDVVTTPDGYRLLADHDSLDTAAFEQLLTAAAEAPRQTAVDLYDEALALWRGPAFGSLADLGPVRLEATRLDQRRLVAAEDRLALLLDLGRCQTALPDLEALVQSEPLRERLRGQLMRALYWTGRQAEALEVYRGYRHLLGEELGLDPSAELRSLHDAVVRDDVAPAAVEPTGPTLSGSRGAAVAAGPGPAALERAAWDALWAGDHDASVEARQDAYVGLLRAGDRPGAARLAIWLGVNAAIRLRNALAFGWFGRAERLLQGVAPGPSHALLAGLGGLVAVLQGHLDVAIGHAIAAQELGDACGDLDVQALGRVIEGWARIRSGQRAAGLALVDEAMVSAVAGELSPYVTGLVYCRTLCACLDLMDYQRAVEWTDEMDRLRATGGPADLPGDCRTHRVAILLVRGEWAECEAQALVAAEETASFDMTHLALTEASMGELLLRRGDLEGARERLLAAQEMGASPHPALALLRLAEGDVGGAAEEIANQVAEVGHDPLPRARLLPAVVDIALERGDLGAAREAVEDLRGIADTFGTSALQAEALSARGRWQVASGDPGGAMRSARAALRRWREVGSAYRVAIARLDLAEALAAAGRTTEADNDARAAHRVLARIGAVPDAARASALMQAMVRAGRGAAVRPVATPAQRP